MTTPGGSSHGVGVPGVIGLPLGTPDIGAQYTLADVDPIGRTEVMIYSAPGKGKTVMAATFPPPFRWLAADGATSLKSLAWAFKAGKTSITDPKTDLVAYSPTEDLSKGAYPSKPIAFDRTCDMIGHWFSPGEVDKWKTLVIDPLTEISEWCMYKGLSLNTQLPDPKKPLSGSHGINEKAKARIVTGQQDFKSAMALLEGFISDVRVDCSKHNKNLVVLCHEWTETNEDGQVIRYEPLLIGQLRQRMPKSFDDVWYIEMFTGANGPDPKVQVHADPRHICKSRWGTALSSSEDPDFRKMIAKVKAFHGL